VYYLLILIVLIFNSTNTWAQEDIKYNILQAWDVENQLQQNQLEQRAAKLQFLPDLTLTPGFEKSDYLDESDSREGALVYLQSHLNLFRGGTDLAKIKKTFVEEKKLEIEKSVLKNKFTVAKFLLLGERFILEKEADLINTSLQEFERLKGIAAKRANTGLSSAADSLELEIKTKQLKQKLSHLELELKKNTLALFETLGTNPNLKELIEDYNKIKTKLSELTLKNDETESLEQNKYLQHLQAQLEVFELELKTATQKFMPEVDLETKYGQITPMKKLLDRSDEYMVALNIKIPLFDKGVSNLEQQRIKGDYERQRKIFQLANLTMPIQNEILRQEIIDTKIKLENDKKILEKRIKLKKLISADFRRGVKELGDLVDSWTESIDAEVDFMKSELQSNTKLLNFSLLNSKGEWL
jgi:hypothetical protein